MQYRPCKMGELIELPFGVVSGVGSRNNRNCVLDGRLGVHIGATWQIQLKIVHISCEWVCHAAFSRITLGNLRYLCQFTPQ